MYQKERRGSLNYVQWKKSSNSSQVVSPRSCPDTKKSFALAHLRLPQPLPPIQSLSKFTLKSRISMKKLAAMTNVCADQVQQCGNFFRSSTTFEGKGENASVCEMLNSGSKSTEEALDALAAHTKPRRSRMSFCVGSTIGQQPVAPEKLKELKVFELIPWQDPPKKEVKSSSPTCFINLPQLPFGRHRSYNDVKDIRGLIVSRKEKARRRRKVIKAFDDHFDS